MATTALHRSSAVAGRPSVGIARRVLSVIGNYIAKNRTERLLSQLDDRMLKDIGLSRGEIRGRIWQDRH